ncbi:MAG: hypothetical protein ACREDR_26505 [Blastocatellia bacterium]
MTAKEFCEKRRSSPTMVYFGISPPLKDPCADCGAPSTSIVSRTAYCERHGHERHFGTPYLEPRPEDKKVRDAQISALVDMMDSGFAPVEKSTNAEGKEVYTTTCDDEWIDEYKRRVGQHLKPN